VAGVGGVPLRGAGGRPSPVLRVRVLDSPQSRNPCPAPLQGIDIPGKVRASRL
jgi:hypothetical protein